MQFEKHVLLELFTHTHTLFQQNYFQNLVCTVFINIHHHLDLDHTTPRYRVFFKGGSLLVQQTKNSTKGLGFTVDSGSGEGESSLSFGTFGTCELSSGDLVQ